MTQPRAERHAPGSVSTWPGIAAAVADDVAVLKPRAARLAAEALDLVAAVNQTSLSPEARHVRDVLRHVANRGGRLESQARALADAADAPDVRNHSGPTPSTHERDGIPWIGTTEAAALLKCSPRHVGRLAQEGQLGTRKAGNRRLVDRTDVLELTITRRTAS